MEAYAGNRDDDLSIECSEVDLMCSKKELDELISALLKFQHEINQYIQKHKSNIKLGTTHMHYRDNTKLWKESDADVVIYVDLDK